MERLYIRLHMTPSLRGQRQRRPPAPLPWGTAKFRLRSKHRKHETHGRAAKVDPARSTYHGLLRPSRVGARGPGKFQARTTKPSQLHERPSAGLRHCPGKVCPGASACIAPACLLSRVRANANVSSAARLVTVDKLGARTRLLGVDCSRYSDDRKKVRDVSTVRMKHLGKVDLAVSRMFSSMQHTKLWLYAMAF